jgi:MFS family permease
MHSLLAYLWLIASCYGLSWSAFIVLLTRFFHGNNLEEIVAAQFVLSPALGSLILNVISGAIYDKHGTKQPDGTVLCYGTICYQETYLISFAMDALGVVLCIVLYLYDRKIRRNQFKSEN